MRFFRWIRRNPLITLDLAKAILLLILAIAFINFNMRLSDQVKATRQIADNQNKTILALSKSDKKRDQQFTSLQNHIDCIVALFQQPNRDNLIISDIKNCKLDSNGIAHNSSKSPPKAGQALSPTPQTQTAPSPSSSPSSPQPAPSSLFTPKDLGKQILNLLDIKRKI